MGRRGSRAARCGPRRAIAEHRETISGPGGLYEELRFEAPWLLPRLQRLERQLARIETAAADLAADVERVRNGETGAIGNIRLDADRMLNMLLDLMANENDLVYERFNEPVALD